MSKTMLTIHTPFDGLNFGNLSVDVTDCRAEVGHGFLAARLTVEETEVTVYLHGDTQRSLFVMALQELAAKLQEMPIGMTEAEEYEFEKARGDFGDDVDEDFTCDCCPIEDEPEQKTGPWLRTDLKH